MSIEVMSSKVFSLTLVNYWDRSSMLLRQEKNCNYVLKNIFFRYFLCCGVDTMNDTILFTCWSMHRCSSRYPKNYLKMIICLLVGGLSLKNRPLTSDCDTNISFGTNVAW
jgi:hypothetical protein